MLNLAEVKDKLAFSREELKGFPESRLQQLEKDPSGKFLVGLDYPTIFPAMRLVQVPKTREALERAFNSRCKDSNSEILSKLVTMRAERAKLLGYPTHSAYVLEVRMARTPEKVKEFLADLSYKLEATAQDEWDALCALKKQECQRLGYDSDGRINQWDFGYYTNLYKEKTFNIDPEEIKAYFPLEVVTASLLELYQELLQLKFRQVPPDQAHCWHPDVSLFTVTETTRPIESDDDKSNALAGTQPVAEEKAMGHFYLDLFPRPGKYSHAACFGLVSGCGVLKEGGSRSQGRRLPVAAMIANFTKPTATTPALLTHDEVVTYFHEFGHVMHNLSSKTDLARFAGTAVERDFVEAPSQMLENWCWQKAVLRRISQHHETRQPLPEEMLSKMLDARNANVALLTKRQIIFGTFDQKVHTSDKVDDLAQVYAQVTEAHSPVLATPGTNFAASFGHLTGGYDASYYGYIWSEVFSCDMFESKFSGNRIFSPGVGYQYRNLILSKGASKDGEELLQDFLGRKPSLEPFLKSKGLGPSLAAAFSSPSKAIKQRQGHL
eukprot:g62688.t1